MKIQIFSLSENLSFCQNLSFHLNALGHECTVYESISKFMLEIDEQEDKPDLFILDFYLYNHYVFNPYSYLKENRCYVPLISFNDPQRKTVSESFYWKNMLELLYADKFQWEKYQVVIEQTIGLLERLKEKTITAEKEMFKSEGQEKTERNNEPKNLSSSEIIIYKMLKSNLDQAISIKELQESIKKTSKICRESTIACIISSLRKKLDMAEMHELQIIKNGTGYKMISL